MRRWPVAIIVFFALFIASMVAFVVWSTHQREELVSATYYDEELAYQQRIDAIARARTEGVAPRIAYAAQHRQIELHFPIPAALQAASGTVTLYRPSEAALDQRCTLLPDAAGLQQIAAANLKPGLWRVKAEWTTAGKAYYAEEALMVQ